MESFGNPIQDFIPAREIPRRRLIHSGIAQQKFRRAVLEAAAEISSEFKDHYWKEAVNGNKTGPEGQPLPLPPSTSNQSLKQRFVFYLNASGRYLVLREHLRRAVSHIVQQRCLNLRPSGFQSHRDFQTLLHDMYNYLIDEVHESLNRTQLHEGDPLEPAPPKIICDTTVQPPNSLKVLGTKTLLRELLFYSEESFVQGDFDNCHKIHLSRICRSREDSNCWLDFAIMWLSRGDDRMAEIAVREALRRDPTSIYALVIGGIIAARHTDSRGVAVLAAALEMKPLSPELLVILALAHISIGAEEASDYFFRKAAFLHRTLTGQSTQDLDEILTKLAVSIGTAASITDISKAEQIYPPPQIVNQPEETEIPEEEQQPSDFDLTGRSGSRISAESIPSNPSPKGRKISIDKDKTENSKKKSIFTRKSLAKNDSGDVDAEFKKLSERKSSDLKRKSITKKLPKLSIIPEINVPEVIIVPEIVQEEAGDEFYTRKISLSREEPPKYEPKPHPEQPKFDFIPDLSDLIVEDSILPPLRPSLLVPWNVTLWSDQLKSLLPLNAEDRTELGENVMFGGEEESVISGLAPVNVIQAEYDKIVNTTDNVSPHSSTMITDSNLERNSGSINGLEVGASNQSITGRKSDPEKETEILETKYLNKESLSTQEIQELLQNPPEEIPPPEAENVEEGANGNDENPPIFVNRLGSELIWTGQLLLQLRMFDMLDGVLTRELYTTGKRSIQFLYLRVMSLYLRRCQREALPVIDEALVLDPENPVLWMLRGHCYYEMGDNENAARNYETALRIPVGKENRHLLYLRFGTLALDSGNVDTAKRVFLYGIQKYPTPYLWLAIGNTCYTMGDYEEAEAAFAEANRLDNTNPITWAHLSLINLACDRQALAEQSYKWAIRFGLKKGKVLEEIKKLQLEKGFGDPSFPRIPNCIPHDYYIRRLGRQKPFDIYRDALMNEAPTMGKKRFDNTERENALKEKLQQPNNAEQQKEVKLSIIDIESNVPATTELTVVPENEEGGESRKSTIARESLKPAGELEISPVEVPPSPENETPIAIPHIEEKSKKSVRNNHNRPSKYKKGGT